MLIHIWCMYHTEMMTLFINVKNYLLDLSLYGFCRIVTDAEFLFIIFLLWENCVFLVIPPSWRLCSADYVLWLQDMMYSNRRYNNVNTFRDAN